MEVLRRRILRLLGFVERMKRGRHPNAETFAADLLERDLLEGTDLAASARTIKRDIAYLRDVLGAPLEYDRMNGGYVLIDERWCFPLQAIGGGAAFPELALGEGHLPTTRTVFREAMFSPVALVDPAHAEVQVVLPLVMATNGTPDLDVEVVEQLLYAWKDKRVVRIAYASPRRAATERDIEIYSVFIQEGIWYARAWCRLREALRTFAFHRIQRAQRLEKSFPHRPEAAEALAEGNVLGFPMVENVVVQATPDSAGFYAEREWFPGQYDRHLPDGSLEMLFPAAPRPVVVSWVLYNAPELEVIAPDDLRAEIAAKAQQLASTHRGRNHRHNT